MGDAALADKIGKPVPYARELIDLHKKVYKKFWSWSEKVVNYAMWHGRLESTFGWKTNIFYGTKSLKGKDSSSLIRFTEKKKSKTANIRNFPMQSNGAEMLRLACCFVIEANIKICAPVHDALLIEAPEDEIESVIAETQRLMERASTVILPGFKLLTDCKKISHPDRYKDSRDKDTKIWELVNGIIDSFDSGSPTLSDFDLKLLQSKNKHNTLSLKPKRKRARRNNND